MCAKAVAFACVLYFLIEALNQAVIPFRKGWATLTLSAVSQTNGPLFSEIERDVQVQKTAITAAKWTIHRL